MYVHSPLKTGRQEKISCDFFTSALEGLQQFEVLLKFQ